MVTAMCQRTSQPSFAVVTSRTRPTPFMGPRGAAPAAAALAEQRFLSVFGPERANPVLRLAARLLRPVVRHILDEDEAIRARLAIERGARARGPREEVEATRTGLHADRQ